MNWMHSHAVVYVVSILLAFILPNCGNYTLLESVEVSGERIEVYRIIGSATVADYVDVCYSPRWPWNSAILSAKDADSIHIEVLSDSMILAEIYWLNQSQEWFLADTLHIKLHDKMKCIDWKSPGPDGRKARGL